MLYLSYLVQLWTLGVSSWTYDSLLISWSESLWAQKVPDIKYIKRATLNRGSHGFGAWIKFKDENNQLVDGQLETQDSCISPPMKEMSSTLYDQRFHNSQSHWGHAVIPWAHLTIWLWARGVKESCDLSPFVQLSLSPSLSLPVCLLQSESFH